MKHDIIELQQFLERNKQKLINDKIYYIDNKTYVRFNFNYGEDYYQKPELLIANELTDRRELKLVYSDNECNGYELTNKGKIFLKEFHYV